MSSPSVDKRAMRWPRLAAAVLAGVLAAGAAFGDDPDAVALRRRDAALAAQAGAGPFGAPLQVESSEASRSASGSIHARLPHDFATVAAALAQTGPWCDVLILHLNVKRCERRPDAITLYLGTKHEQPLARAQRLELRRTLEASGPDYLRVRLQASDGPLDTRDTAIVFEAAPAASGGTLVHLQYATTYGTFAHLAMHGYLATLGRDKVGFSMIASPAGGAGVPVRGARGVVERNAMRYYLAIAAYLDSLAVPPAARLEQRLSAWFDATERYRAQLHEIERDEYLAMKRRETAPGVE